MDNLWAICVEVEKLYTTYFRISGDFYCFRLAAFSSFTLYAKASLRRSGTGLDRPSGQSGRGRAGVLGHGGRASAVWVPGGLSRVERGFGRGRRRQRVKVPLAAGQVIRAAPFPSGNGAPRAERRTAGTASAGLEAARRGDGTVVGFTVGYSVRPGIVAREGSRIQGFGPAGLSEGNGFRPRRHATGGFRQRGSAAAGQPASSRGCSLPRVRPRWRWIDRDAFRAGAWPAPRGVRSVAACRGALREFPRTRVPDASLFSRGLNSTQQYFVFSVRASHEL